MKFREIEGPTKKGRETLKALKSKYSQLYAYIVLSNRFGQINPHDSPETTLKEFPKLFIDCPKKLDALHLLEQIRSLDTKIKFSSRDELLKKQKDTLSSKLNRDGLNLEIDAEANVELRFEQLDYEIIDQLRVDPLVDQSLTPQTRASIKIVLGTLKSLSSRGDDD